MKIHHYDSKTGEYLKTSTARVDPLDKTKNLIPANATSLVLPTLKSNEAAVFINNAWQAVPDHRGTTFYKKSDGSKVTLPLGMAPDATISATLPASIVLKNAKLTKQDEVRNAFLLDISAPVAVASVSYHAGIDSGIKLDGAVRLAVKAGQTSVVFTDINNQPNTLTIAQADAVVIAVGTDYQSKFLRKQQAMVSIANASDLTSVNAITY